MPVAGPPIQVVHLFPLLDEMLVELLRSLSPEQWQLPTLAKQWRVKDIAAHLLDGNMRTITASQGYSSDAPTGISSYQQLVDYLNQLNAEWVQAMKRVSPQQIVDLLASTGKQFCDIMANEPLFEPAPFAVAWAGEDVSTNWFHIAREYTEKWHHQMQIREAVGQTELMMQPEFYQPLIETFMYGLPHALRNIHPVEYTCVEVAVGAPCGQAWFVVFNDGRWRLSKVCIGNISASVVLDAGIAWKLFTKGVSPQQAAIYTKMEGDKELCQAVLEMVAVMA